MAETVPHPSRYVVSARGQQGLVQQTRARAASALVLARRWADAGYNDVVVHDPAGRPLTSDRHRASILGGGRYFR